MLPLFYNAYFIQRIVSPKKSPHISKIRQAYLSDTKQDLKVARDIEPGITIYVMGDMVGFESFLVTSIISDCNVVASHSCTFGMRMSKVRSIGKPNFA